MSLVAPFQKFLSGRERRQFPRVEGIALRVVMDGKKYRTLDWSLGGFRINGYHAQVAIKDEITGEIGPVGGTKAGDFVVEVVRVEENGDIGLRFLEIAPRVFMAMSSLRRSL